MYWQLKGACCCHVLGLCSSRRSRSWRQQDPQNIRNFFTIQYRIVLILISWKRMSTAHDTYPLRAVWEPSELSCHVIYISLFMRAKNLIITLLEIASTVFKQCHFSTSLGSGHFRGVIYFTNNEINLYHQTNTVLTVCKYYSLISHTFH